MANHTRQHSSLLDNNVDIIQHHRHSITSELIYYTIMDFLLSKYGLIFTEFDSIDRGGAEVNTFKFNKYQTIFTEQNVHNCFII